MLRPEPEPRRFLPRKSSFDAMASQQIKCRTRPDSAKPGPLPLLRRLAPTHGACAPRRNCLATWANGLNVQANDERSRQLHEPRWSGPDLDPFTGASSFWGQEVAR